MTILLLAIGSHGDVHPFIGLGLALRQRGHRVKILTNPVFAELVEKVGLEFVAIGTAQDFEIVLKNPDLWHRTKGFQVVFGLVLGALRSTYETILQHYVPGETVVAASSLGLAARVAQDKLGIPLATVHLAPAIIRSTIEPPILPGLFMPKWLPRKGKQFLFAVGDKLVIDRVVCPPLNEFRGELGLPPVRGILKDWWHSPQLVVGLFPDWFAPPQADWPAQIKLTGFPLFDEHGVADASPGLAEFLAAGDAPIIFTPGSAMFHAHEFFEESVKAAARLNRRAILLSRHAGHIPANLPSSIRHFTYVPFSQVLPHAAAFVHHGGIGTSAQAMKAGVPQLIIPFCHDQPDNSARMQRLGIARSINPSQYRAKKVAKVLGELLADKIVEDRCHIIAKKFVGIDPIGQTCKLLEDLLRNHRPAAAC